MNIQLKTMVFNLDKNLKYKTMVLQSSGLQYHRSRYDPTGCLRGVPRISVVQKKDVIVTLHALCTRIFLRTLVMHFTFKIIMYKMIVPFKKSWLQKKPKINFKKCCLVVKIQKTRKSIKSRFTVHKISKAFETATVTQGWEEQRFGGRERECQTTAK